MDFGRLDISRPFPPAASPRRPGHAGAVGPGPDDPSAERVAAFLTLFDPNAARSPGTKDDWGMQVVSELMSRQKPWRELLAPVHALVLAFGAVAVLIGGAARAQDLDQGKSAARLFADGCATCHRSPRGLAKGRFSFSLYLFLQKHYASNSSSAWALTSYLESVDGAQRGRSRSAAAKPSPPPTSTSMSPLRPPLPVPVSR